MGSPEVGDDVAPEEVDRLLHLGHRVGDEEQAGERGHAGLLVDADPLADLRRAADEVALLEAARLLAQRGSLQRLQVLVELEPWKRFTASSCVRPIEQANCGAMSMRPPSRPALAAARWTSSTPFLISSGESTAGIQPSPYSAARRRTSG